MTRTAGVLVLAAVCAATAMFAGADTSAPAGLWLSGDLHVHTIWGHDTCISPTEAWKEGVADFNARERCAEPWTWSFSVQERIEEAELRGLDYLAISDHDNVMSQRDPYYAGYEGPVTLIPAYENSLAGHVQMLGARSCYSNTGPVTATVVGCKNLVTDRTLAGMNSLASSLRLDSGAFQVNHPSDHDWETAYGHSFVPDSVEVWNIGAWFWQPPAPASNDNDFSLAWWDGFLSAGHRVAATGGSDSHWRITHSEQGIGQPTTWVFAADRSYQSILTAIRQGRTFISHQYPARKGPLLFFEADSDGNGDFDAIVGDSVPASSGFRIRTQQAAPGSIVRLVTDSGAKEIPLILPDQDITAAVRSLGPAKYVRVELRLPDAQEVRVEHCDLIVRELEDAFGQTATHCRNRIAVLALTSPIYIQ